ncbi:MAG: hypothetical protein K0R07_1059 [Sedimentibacter sp.]|jgi:hypothetical protein|nr:hypothetical protein [Sedimentibacter sp.]
MTKVAATTVDLVDNYLEHVQQIAKSIGKIFMLDIYYRLSCNKRNIRYNCRTITLF